MVRVEGVSSGFGVKLLKESVSGSLSVKRSFEVFEGRQGKRRVEERERE